MSDRAPLIRAIVKARLGRSGKDPVIHLWMACGHTTTRLIEEPAVNSARCYTCERERAHRAIHPPIEQLRLTHYGL